MFAVYYLMINYSDIGGAGLIKLSGGTKILDMEFGFSYDKALSMLTALNAEGRSFYLTRLLPLDFPFPFIYMLFFNGLIALNLKHASNVNRTKYLLLLPAFTMLSDWIENIGIIVSLKNYPDLPAWAVTTASVSGMLKTIFLICGIIAICALSLASAYGRFRKPA